MDVKKPARNAAKGKSPATRPDVAQPAAPAPGVGNASPQPVPPPNQAQTAPPPPRLAAPAQPAPGQGVNFEILSQNMAKLVEGSGRALNAYLEPRQGAEVKLGLSDDVADAVKTLGHIAEHWLSDPARALQAQTQLSAGFLGLWAHTLRRMAGEDSKPVAPPDPGDKRFADKEWRESPMHDFIAQAYKLTTDWASDMVTGASGVDDHTRDRAHFYVRQIAGAVSPSNFVATNPKLLGETISQNGENLVRGMAMLTEDLEAGKGNLKLRQSDSTKFELGVNMALTPGKVIYRNDLIELLQYAPSTPDVLKRPLLIFPPWINKFYILDLNPEKSFVRWAVSQGLTVFVVSWVNPDERHAKKDFESYMREGVFGALDAIEQATGENDVTAVGYCVGGTLLSVALAHMAATGDKRLSSATLFTTQVDFTDPGDLKVFVDEKQISATETEMEKTGYLDGAKMANAFNMLRPNDLIWSYVVNNYVKGIQPSAFDLLTWNSDSTRMPQANHSFYLRNCYLENKLTKGTMVVGGVTLDLGKVKIPIYDLAAREDHIAPAKSVFTGAKYFGGEVRYVLSGSGHIAGVVNPPTKVKYQYWLGPKPVGEFDAWVAAATEHPGSWWPDWMAWIRAQAPAMVKARVPGDGKLAPLCDAPGTYVRVKA